MYEISDDIPRPVTMAGTMVKDYGPPTKHLRTLQKLGDSFVIQLISKDDDSPVREWIRHSWPQLRRKVPALQGLNIEFSLEQVGQDEKVSPTIDRGTVCRVTDRDVENWTRQYWERETNDQTKKQ